LHGRRAAIDRSSPGPRSCVHCAIEGPQRRFCVPHAARLTEHAGSPPRADVHYGAAVRGQQSRTTRRGHLPGARGERHPPPGAGKPVPGGRWAMDYHGRRLLRHALGLAGGCCHPSGMTTCQEILCTYSPGCRPSAAQRRTNGRRRSRRSRTCVVPSGVADSIPAHVLREICEEVDD
jgi:hypothetical protein